MDSTEYRRRGKEMVDYIADYLDNIRSRPVFPDVSPGYMRKLVPECAPEEGEAWDDIFKDIERVIMPGITHWQSPYMHAYFPGLNSFPSLLGDMLANAMGCICFTWASSPACTELETIVMDWLGKLIGLPSVFLHSNKQTMGGGVIQTTASEATFVALLAARTEVIKRQLAIDPDTDIADINSRLVAYCSDQAHSSVEKGSLIGLVKLRLLDTDDQLSLRGNVFGEAVREDIENGFIPFYLCATLGTTGACAFDNLRELGPICEEHDIWMHIDAAYAGTALICPEYRHFIAGIEHAQSFAFNPSKWMMVHFDCTAMWVKNSGALHRTFNVDPLYLKHENTGAAIDYMHWQIPLSRRFRALKLWFVLRSFGVKGLQAHVRKGVELAKHFEQLVRADTLFEVPAERFLGMVVFKLKGENELTETLLTKLNRSGKVHMVPASLKGSYVIRFTVTSPSTCVDDIERDWAIIRGAAVQVLDGRTERQPVAAAGERRRQRGLKRVDFGRSLVLSNVPLSPKFINGSFAAMFDDKVIIEHYARHLQHQASVDFNGRPIRLSPRRRTVSERDRQNSFDLSAARPRRAAQVKHGSLDSQIEELFHLPVTRGRAKLHTIVNGTVSEEHATNDDSNDDINDDDNSPDNDDGSPQNGDGGEENDNGEDDCTDETEEGKGAAGTDGRHCRDADSAVCQCNVDACKNGCKCGCKNGCKSGCKNGCKSGCKNGCKNGCKSEHEPCKVLTNAD